MRSRSTTTVPERAARDPGVLTYLCAAGADGKFCGILTASGVRLFQRPLGRKKEGEAHHFVQQRHPAANHPSEVMAAGFLFLWAEPRFRDAIRRDALPELVNLR